LGDYKGNGGLTREQFLYHETKTVYDSKELYYLIIEKEDSTDLPERIEFQIDIAFAADDFGFFG
jgi:hypothetical protein